MTHGELSGVTWRKSSYSAVNQEECIEVGDGIPSLLPVRDSKDPGGPVLVFTATAWSAFVADVKAGRFPV